MKEYHEQKKKENQPELGEFRFGITLGWFNMRTVNSVRNSIDSLCYKHNLNFRHKVFKLSMFKKKIEFVVQGTNKNLKEFAREYNSTFM